MLLALLRGLLWCPHDEMVRERHADGSYHVRCSRCGYSTPLLRRVSGQKV